MTQKEKIYQYLKTHRTLPENAISDYFSSYGESKIKPSTIERRLREYRAETERIENINKVEGSNLKIDNPCYLIDKHNMVYSVDKPKEKEVKEYKYDNQGQGLFI